MHACGRARELVVSVCVSGFVPAVMLAKICHHLVCSVMFGSEFMMSVVLRCAPHASGTRSPSFCSLYRFSFGGFRGWASGGLDPNSVPNL